MNNNFTNLKKIFLLIGIGIFLIAILFLLLMLNSEEDINNLNKNTVSSFNHNFSSLEPIGAYYFSDIFSDEHQAIAIGHYYQKFGGENKKVFESGPFYNSASDITGTTITYSILSEEGHKFFISDLESGISELIGIIPSDKGYSNSINSLILSSDNNFVYTDVTYYVEDYNSLRNNPDFGIADMLLTSELYRINVKSQQVDLLYSQTTNLETFYLNYITDNYLILTIINTELDWQNIGFFNLEEKKIVKIIKNDFPVAMSLSLNKKYLYYNLDLMSKVGDIDPAGSVIIEMENLSKVPAPVFQQYDFKSSISNLDNSSAWVNWWRPYWGDDNASLYFIKGSIMVSSKNGNDLYQVNLISNSVSKLLNIPEKFFNPELKGVYNDNYYIQTNNNDNTQLYLFPDEKLLVEYEGYNDIHLVINGIN